jgi:hypothetical protein
MPSRGDPEVLLLVRRIIDEAEPGALKPACDELHARLARLAGLPHDSRQSDDVTPRRLDSGTAIAPLDAARCVQDLARTALFMRGVRAAVADASQRFPGTTVEVLYAGCGPLAPLALPLVADCNPGEVRLTLVDAHERSLRAARQLYARLDALAHVRTFVHADAAGYTVDARWPPHVLLIECMQRALTKEPQVAITRRLAPQLVPGGILVPERITVDACLADLSKEFALDASRPLLRDRIPLARLLMLSKESHDPSPPVVVEIPDDARRYDLQLLTTIQVYGDMVLGDYDSGITFPLVIPGAAAARSIEFRYQDGANPGWHHRALQ